MIATMLSSIRTLPLRRIISAKTRIFTRLNVPRYLPNLLQSASMVYVSKVEKNRASNVSCSVHVEFGLLNSTDQTQKTDYISLFFHEDDPGHEPADVVWTFPIPKGANLSKVLMGHLAEMRYEAYDDEYARAYSSFVTKLWLSESSSGPSLASTTGGEVDMKLPEDKPCRPTKATGSNLLVPGEARDEEIRLRLEEGQSFLDLASTLNRTPEFITREGRRLLGESKLGQLMKHNKRGPWTSDEDLRLATLRGNGRNLRDMSALLRRTRPSIQKRLRELGSSIFEQMVVEGPQELAPGLRESLFEARLAEIWNGLLKTEMTQTWRAVLQEKAPERWLAAISAGIPIHVKRFLGGLECPTWAELKSIALTDTKDAGVYARLVESRFEIQAAGDRHVYIGSASKYGVGLSGRIAQHTERRPRRNQSRLQQDIRKKDLKGGDRFITLMTMKLDSPDNDTVLDVRRTLTLAEAILTIWLGALQSPSHYLDKLCPWDTSLLAYSGWSSHNPLLVDVTEPRHDIPSDGTDPD
ncbi:hypothetical protein DHEL01_v210315 [Diaporthe helianthi]|uniref:Uncharacterized protein n=1 Tax=Diaporthe helianthi TaxID=158607 RepID=A0A2P5HM34_DIAHE|nr:hypothetical protein DHEL01_v210315 [Diaporthe helianthi]